MHSFQSWENGFKSVKIFEILKADWNWCVYSNCKLKSVWLFESLLKLFIEFFRSVETLRNGIFRLNEFSTKSIFHLV